MAKVLVTGVGGFLGSHVAECLLKKGHKVIGFDNLSGGLRENVPNGVIFYKGDICNKTQVEILFSKEKPEYVYHLAAYAAEGLSHFIRRYNYTNNVIGSINLINASVNHDVKHFVFTSSMAVYGSNILPFKESLVPKPEDPYGIAKLTIEKDLEAANHLFQLKYTIFRPHNIYGSKQNINDKYRNVIGIFMKQIMEDKALTIFGNGEQTRAFSYIDDVAPYIASAPFVKEALNGIFNIGGDQPYTINQLIKELGKVFKINPTYRYLPERQEVYGAYCDHTKLRECFKIVKTSTPLSVGLKKMAQWAKTQTKSKKTRTMKPEIEKNLPLSWK